MTLEEVLELNILSTRFLKEMLYKDAARKKGFNTVRHNELVYKKLSDSEDFVVRIDLN